MFQNVLVVDIQKGQSHLGRYHRLCFRILHISQIDLHGETLIKGYASFSSFVAEGQRTKYA